MLQLQDEVVDFLCSRLQRIPAIKGITNSEMDAQDSYVDFRMMKGKLIN